MRARAPVRGDSNIGASINAQFALTAMCKGASLHCTRAYNDLDRRNMRSCANVFHFRRDTGGWSYGFSRGRSVNCFSRNCSFSRGKTRTSGPDRVGKDRRVGGRGGGKVRWLRERVGEGEEKKFGGSVGEYLFPRLGDSRNPPPGLSFIFLSFLIDYNRFHSVLRADPKGNLFSVPARCAAAV